MWVLSSDYLGLGGGTPIFSYIIDYLSSEHYFLAQNFRKVIFLGEEDLLVFFFGGGGGGHYEIGLFFGGEGVISIDFRAF